MHSSTDGSVGRALPGALCALPVIVLVMLRIETYVTGQDPEFYIGLARALQIEPMGSAAFVEAFTRVSPGYPVLLALARAWFGSFAPYWVNPVFGVLWVWGCGVIAGHLGDPGRRLSPGLAQAVAGAVVLFGHGLNPHFLFYPFRELAGVSLAFAGIVCVLRGAAAERFRWWLAGGVTGLFLASTVRESMILLWLGAAIWMMVRPGRGSGWLRRFGLLTALALAVGLGAGLGMAGVGGSVHARAALGALWSIGEDGAVLAAASAVAAQTGYVLDELGWLGVVLALTALVAGRRTLFAPCALLGPAAAAVVLYGTVEVHRRHALELILVLSPLCGAGAAIGMERFSRRVSSVRTARLSGAAVTALVVAGIVVSARSLAPWGPAVSRHEVRTFRDAIDRVAGEGGLVFSEWACRYAGGAVVAHASSRMARFTEPREWEAIARSNAIFLKPLNREAAYAPITERFPVSMESELRHTHDMIPVTDADGAAVEVEIAGGRFALFRVEEKTRTEVRVPLRGKVGRRLVIWLDLGHMPAGARTAIELRSRTKGDIVYSRAKGELRGMVVLAIDAVRYTTPDMDLVLSSTAPLPSDPLFAFVWDEGYVPVDLTFQRPFSANPWFRPPFEPVLPGARFPAVLRREGSFCLPEVIGDVGEVDIRFVYSPARGAGRPRAISYSLGGSLLGSLPVAPSADPVLHEIIVPKGGIDPLPCVEIRATGVDQQPVAMRMSGLRVRVR